MREELFGEVARTFWRSRSKRRGNSDCVSLELKALALVGLNFACKQVVSLVHSRSTFVSFPHINISSS